MAKRVGRRVAFFRERMRDMDGKPIRMTAQALADRCAELGHPLDRSVIAKLEKGHRLTVSVADWVVLARALGVPPPLLIVGLGTDDEIEILPGTRRPSWDAFKWLTGTAAFPADPSRHPKPTALAGTHADNQAYANTAIPIMEHREYDAGLIDCFWEAEREAVLEELIGAAGDDAERERLRGELQGVRERLAVAERDLAEHRLRMRRLGVVPPPLPAFLRARLGERSFVVYERFDASGRLAERRSVAAGSQEDHLLATDDAWRLLDLPFQTPPADYVNDEEGES